MNPFTNQGNQNNPYLQNAYAQQNFMANLSPDMQSMVNGFSPQKVETNTSASPQQQQPFDPQTNATLMANLIAKRQMYGGQQQQQQPFNSPVTSNPSIIGSPAAVSSMGMQSPQQQRQQSPMMSAQQMAQMQQQAYRNPQQQQQAYRNPQQQMAQMSRMDEQQRQQFMLMQQQQLMRKQQQQAMVPLVTSTSTSSIPTSTMSPINPSNNIESPMSAIVGPSSSNDIKSLAADSDINTKRVEVVSLTKYIYTYALVFTLHT
jgi:hypothetical protein